MTCLPSRKSSPLSILALSFLQVSFLLLCAQRAPAQLATSAVNGTVTDACGAAVPGAKITLSNVATNVTRVTSIAETRNYLLGSIMPGWSRLTVGRERLQ